MSTPTPTYTRRYVGTAWHTKHLILTALTGGLWAPIWWLAYRHATRPVYVHGQR